MTRIKLRENKKYLVLVTLQNIFLNILHIRKKNILKKDIKYKKILKTKNN